MRPTLVVFVKEPRPGRVKTRLAGRDRQGGCSLVVPPRHSAPDRAGGPRPALAYRAGGDARRRGAAQPGLAASALRAARAAGAGRSRPAHGPLSARGARDGHPARPRGGHRHRYPGSAAVPPDRGVSPAAAPRRGAGAGERRRLLADRAAQWPVRARAICSTACAGRRGMPWPTRWPGSARSTSASRPGSRTWTRPRTSVAPAATLIPRTPRVETSEVDVDGQRQLVVRGQVHDDEILDRPA